MKKEYDVDIKRFNDWDFQLSFTRKSEAVKYAKEVSRTGEVSRVVKIVDPGGLNEPKTICVYN